ncbi:PAS domain-containing protein [Thioalkalivibrio sp. ALJ16]|uniref:PAS domain-containing protein n=1 Tax=Thioalkalivibrio sp. ALJ16 TaxID=1158762 RepID=UPI00035F434B|nr:PAS domain-containing protein [Thioalkalivibrio sp. ALJ16]
MSAPARAATRPNGGESPGLARLRHEFLQGLVPCVERVMGLAQALDGTPEDRERLLRLQREVHPLAHSARVFGLGRLFSVAESLQAALVGVGPVAPGPDRELIHAGVERLQAAIEGFRQHAVPGAQAVASSLGGSARASRVLLVDDGGPVGEAVAGLLEARGFRLLRLSREAPEVPSLADDPCTAVVLCADRVELQGAGLPAVPAGMDGTLPVLAVAGRWSPGARVECVRRGVSRCLDYPLAGDTLIEQLAQIGGAIVDADFHVLLVTAPGGGGGLAAALGHVGLEVDTASDPEAVLAHMDGTGTDVVVLDLPALAEPVESFAALLRGRENGGSTPLLILTDDPGEVNRLMTLHPGVVGVFLEPVEPARIAAVITARARQLRQMDGVSESYRQALYEREREHLAVNEHALVSIADAAGNIVYANDRFSRVSGYAISELLGRNHRILKSGQHPPAFYAELWATIAAGRVWRGEMCNRARDGSLYWVETTIVPYLGADGRPYQYVSIRTEITHVKNQEYRLRSSQIFANMGTWEWTPDCEQLVWSERIPPLLGYPEGGLEPTVSSFMQAVHPDDRERLRNAIASSLRRGSYFELEHRVIWPDGSEHWLLERGDVVRNAEGEVLYMLGVMQDITKRKTSELALSRLSTRLQEAQRLARIGNWEMDTHSGEFDWSRVIYEILDIDPGQSRPTRADYLRRVPPDERERVAAFLDQLHAPEPREITHRLRLPNGHSRYVHLIAGASPEAGAAPVRVAGTLQDITELHEAQEYLALFRKLFETSEQGISIFDRKGRFVFNNPAALEMLGYTDSHLKGVGYYAIIPEAAAREAAEIEHVRTQGGAWTGKLPLRCRNGAVFISASTIGVVNDERGEPQYGFNIFSDFTDELLRRSELHRAREAAEAASRAKSEFLSNMSHELRTPMNAVLGFAQLLERDTSLGEQQRAYLDEIGRAGRHLLDLINEVLDLARIEAGQMSVESEAVALDPVMEDCLGLMRPLAEERQVECELDADRELGVQGDARRVKQVLLNLLSNAVKYNRPGGHIRLSVQARGARVRVAVADDGPGLTPEQQARLFQPFERLAADRDSVEGSGVGLAITRHLVELMHGEIGVESQPGAGSTFWFELPRAARGQDPAGSRADVAAGALPAATGRCRVLCVDDHAPNLDLLQEMLRQHQHVDCLQAQSAEQGLELAMSRAPDLILLDLNMPVMDGYQVLRALQSEADLSAIPVVAVTADATAATRDRVLAAGFSDCVVKPVSAQALARALKTCQT